MPPSTDTFDFDHLSLRSSHHFTERLAQRPLAASDAWPLYSACQVPAFNANLLWEAPPSAREVVFRVEGMLEKVRNRQLFASSMVVRDTGEWAGVLRAFPSLIEGLTHATLEGGIWVHPKFWHGGLAVEMGQLFTDTLFLEVPALRCFVARVSKDNRAANRLVRSLGFSVVGEGLTFREDGRPMEILHHAITREEWAVRKASARRAALEQREHVLEAECT
jgi:RimJ/RimL family protein N-acetyltransferase